MIGTHTGYTAEKRISAWKLEGGERLIKDARACMESHTATPATIIPQRSTRPALRVAAKHSVCSRNKRRLITRRSLGGSLPDA